MGEDKEEREDRLMLMLVIEMDSVSKQYIDAMLESTTPVGLMRAVCSIIKILKLGSSMHPQTTAKRIEQELEIALEHADAALAIWEQVCEDREAEEARNN